MEKLPAFNNESLKKYCLKSALIKQTTAQILKDFNQYGIELSLPDSEAINIYQELHAAIAPTIKKLLGTNAALLMELLYRIDINEAALSNADENETVENEHDKIARLIIYRELQKVVTRNYFSKQV